MMNKNKNKFTPEELNEIHENSYESYWTQRKAGELTSARKFLDIALKSYIMLGNDPKDYADDYQELDEAEAYQKSIRK